MTTQPALVAYYHVSTEWQGKSGRKDDRPQFAAAVLTSAAGH